MPHRAQAGAQAPRDRANAKKIAKSNEQTIEGGNFQL
jgi:hypothetical protein